MGSDVVKVETGDIATVQAAEADKPPGRYKLPPEKGGEV
jgi:hypothetical protein